MTAQVSSRLQTSFKNISQTAGITGVILGCLVLIGWQFGIPSLKSVLPGLATMKANTALGFILVGASLWLKLYVKSNKQIYLAGQAGAALAALLGLLTLGEYIWELNFGIDQILYRDIQTSDPSYPGRMSLTTAINFALLGTALVLQDVEIRKDFLPAQFLTLTAGAIAAIALIAYLYNVDSLYSVGIYSSMALHTALAFALLSLGVLCASPQAGWMKIVSTEAIGGVVLRRLLPLTIGIPIGLGLFILFGQKAGLYDSQFGLVSLVILNMTLVAVALWISASSLNRVDDVRQHAETSLQENQEQLAGIFNSAMDAIISINEEQVITNFNPAAETMFQYQADDVLGKPLTILIPKRLQSTHEEDVKSFAQTSVTKRTMGGLGKVFGVGADGDEFPLEASISKIEIGGKRIFTAILRDITERTRVEDEIRKLNEELEQRVEKRTLALHASEEQYRTLFNSIDEGFCIIEMIFDNREKPVDYRFLSVNPAFEKQTGLIDAQGKTMRWFAPNHEDYWFDIYGKIALTGEPARFENRAEQLRRWYDVYAFRFGKARKKQVAILFNDITARKETEAKIQQLNKDLRQHTTQLEAANKELEAFSYSVSHDLRTPLRTIDGFSQALLEDYGEQLPEEAQGYLTRVRKAAQRMALLIDDLLNLSKVTRVFMKLVPVDLSQLVQGIAAELQHAQPERRVNFKITPNLKASGDSSLLQAVLENLLNNAWKFTAKREQAEIEFGSKHEKDEIIYFVRDNGAGFDMTYASKLFGAFQRLHAMAEFPGTGVGLATVQRIIHRHGGRVWAEADVDQGATFFFTLPALERAKPRTVPEKKDSLDKRAKEII
jgi:PAS domain S-box-containing protein